MIDDASSSDYATISNLRPLQDNGIRCYPATVADVDFTDTEIGADSVRVKFVIIVEYLDSRPEQAMLSDIDLSMRTDHAISIEIRCSSNRELTLPMDLKIAALGELCISSDCHPPVARQRDMRARTYSLKPMDFTPLAMTDAHERNSNQIVDY